MLRSVLAAVVADDVTQNAFCRFLEKPPDQTSRSAQRAYLYRIATRLTKDHWRQSQRQREYFEAADFQESEPGSTAARDLDLRHDVSKMFEQLTERERSLLWLAYVDNYKHEEVAEILELQPKSIRVLLHRARKSLSEIMAQADVTIEDLL